MKKMATQTTQMQFELTHPCTRPLGVVATAFAVAVVAVSTTKIRHNWRSGGLRREGALH